MFRLWLICCENLQIHLAPSCCSWAQEQLSLMAGPVRSYSTYVVVCPKWRKYSYFQLGTTEHPKAHSTHRARADRNTLVHTVRVPANNIVELVGPQQEKPHSEKSFGSWGSSKNQGSPFGSVDDTHFFRSLHWGPLFMATGVLSSS